MTTTYKHAKRELDILTKFCKEKENESPIIKPFEKEILSLCEKFGKSGQSGGSAPYTAVAISKAIQHLLLQEPICPITGDDDEWVDVGKEVGKKSKTVYQNNRCSAVFKGGDRGEKPYYLDAVIFKDENGVTFTNMHGAKMSNGKRLTSWQRIKFPFTPKSFYIDVVTKDMGNGRTEDFVKNEKQVEKIYKHYIK